MKILCIGHISYDIAMPVAEYPVENKKYRIEEKNECVGGPAANAAYLLGKWQSEVALAGVVGYDTYGNKIQKTFKDLGVIPDHIEINYETETSTSFIIINQATGSRTVFNLAKERPVLKNLKWKINPDIILVDGHDYEASINAVKSFPNAITVIDAGRATSENLELCKSINYIVCSKEFAEEVAGAKFNYNDPNEMAKVYMGLKAKYPKSQLVITLEDKGSMYMLGESIRIMPAIRKEKIVDTTGAGDIYHGAFVYGLANNYDLEMTIKIATITAGMSCERLGGSSSIPELAEVLDYYEKHK